MDSAVMIRFIDFLDNIFGRINSKRLLIFYGLLVFLAFALTRPNIDPNLVIWVAGVASLIAALLYFLKTPDDKLNEAKIKGPKVAAPAAATTAMLILALGSMLAMPGTMKAEENRGTELIGASAIGYLVTDASIRMGSVAQPKWERSLRGFAWGAVIVSLRELLETKATSNTPFDGERFGAGLLGSGIRAGAHYEWNF